MYADAVLYVRPGDEGSLPLTASPGGVWLATDPIQKDRTLPAINMASPAAAAARLPDILAALEAPPLPLSDICIGIIPDQRLTIGEVIALRDAVAATGVRRVEFLYTMQADD